MPILENFRNPYDTFALIYSCGIAEDFCRRAWPVIGHLLSIRIPERGRILDLCCGSGQMARELSQCGYLVTGLDESLEMVRIARKNSPNATFLQADARHFSLLAHFDAVLSSFNSLAHASTLDELVSIVKNVRAALKPHGTLLFDLSMEVAYTAKWRGSFGGSQADDEWIVRPSYDRNSHTAKNNVTVMRQIGERCRRSDFTIIQRCFSEEEVHTALNCAGFNDVDSFDAESDLGMVNESGRRFFLCH